MGARAALKSMNPFWRVGIAGLVAVVLLAGAAAPLCAQAEESEAVEDVEDIEGVESTVALTEEAPGAITQTITNIFGPPLHLLFDPINVFLGWMNMIMARVVTLALFVGTMIWVWSLHKEYVNLDAPSKAWYCDLRVWTVISMLPHIVVYMFL